MIGQVRLLLIIEGADVGRWIQTPGLQLVVRRNGCRMFGMKRVLMPTSDKKNVLNVVTSEPQGTDSIVDATVIGELRSFLVDTYRGVWLPSPVNHNDHPAISMREADVEVVCIETWNAITVELLLPRRIRSRLHMKTIVSDGWRPSPTGKGRLCFDVRTGDDLRHLEEALLTLLGPDVSHCR